MEERVMGNDDRSGNLQTMKSQSLVAQLVVFLGQK